MDPVTRAFTKPLCREDEQQELEISIRTWLQIEGFHKHGKKSFHTYTNARGHTYKVRVGGTKLYIGIYTKTQDNVQESSTHE